MRFRPDIEGIRGIAVLLVVLYHAQAPGFSGGFIGVDVFYVISGFLITNLIVQELTATGSVDFARFYARRARRILPAALVVLVAVAVVVFVRESPLVVQKTFGEIAAAALFIPNILFALHATDYLQPVGASPVLHYWSLGVEEQFYLLWPAFLALAFRLGARTPGRLAMQIAAVGAASFGLSIAWVSLDPTQAFYVLPTRAWELALGGLVGLVLGRYAPAARWQSTVLATLAVAAIAVPAVLYGPSVAFPGVAALPPVLGAAGLIWIGGTGVRSVIAGALEIAPLRFLGRISYSLYLWHWPVLLLAPRLFPEVEGTLVTCAALGLSIGLATLTYWWIETPLRRGRFVGVRPRGNLLRAAAATAVLGVGALVAGRAVTTRFDGPPTQLVSYSPGSTIGPDLIAPATDRKLPPDLDPALTRVDETVPLPILKGCNVTGDGAAPLPCQFGDPAGDRTVVLFGDSHALQWFPALDAIARAEHWSLVDLTKDSCPYAAIARLSNGRPDTACAEWRAAAFEQIRATRPWLVVAGGNHTIVPSLDGVQAGPTDARALWMAGVRTSVSALRDSGIRIVVIGDTPESPWNVPDCLASSPDAVQACAIPRQQAVDGDWTQAEREVVETAGGWYVDPTAWVCPQDPCAVVRGHYLVFTDTNHLAAPFVSALAPLLASELPAP